MDNSTPQNQPQPGQPVAYTGQQYSAPAYIPQQAGAAQPQAAHPAAQPMYFAGGPRATEIPEYGQTPVPPVVNPVYGQTALSPTAPVPTPKVAAPRANTNSTQNALQIAEIRDGIVIMNDGSFRTVVMVKSINFDLMSQTEQEAVEYSYQGFLNSLYFPIQIFIRSQKVDLQPYIEKLDRIRSQHDNMLLALLMEDYIDYIDDLAQQTNIMDKKFYVVIPFFPRVDVQKALTNSKNFVSGLVSLFNTQEQHVVINEDELEKAKTELRNRVQACLSGLMQCGVQGLPLDTQELIELFYDTYNPDTATRQQLKNLNMLTADIIRKGEGMATPDHLRQELN